MPVHVLTKCTYTDTEKTEREKETLPTSLSHESGWLRDRDHTADSTSAYSSDVGHGVPTKQLLFVELKWSQNEHVFVLKKLGKVICVVLLHTFSYLKNPNE